MTRSTTTRRTPRKTEVKPHDFLLAGIGALSLGRKQALRSIDGLVTGSDQIVLQVDAAARKAAKRIAGFRKQAQARLAPVRKQAEALGRQVQADVETRLAPVLAKFGVKRSPAKRPARAAKRSPRPAAKRARKRA